nr:hypothetical protein NNZKBPFO_HPZBYUEE_CDS_0036 [Przondovirus K11]
MAEDKYTLVTSRRLSRQLTHEKQQKNNTVFMITTEQRKRNELIY